MDRSIGESDENYYKRLIDVKVDGMNGVDRSILDRKLRTLEGSIVNLNFVFAESTDNLNFVFEYRSKTEPNFQEDPPVDAELFVIFKNIPDVIRQRYGMGNIFTMYVRKSYISLYERLKKMMLGDPLAPEFNVCLFTGVPGIGKSLFSLYFLGCYMCDREFVNKSVFLEYSSGQYSQLVSHGCESVIESTARTSQEVTLKVRVGPGVKLSPNDVLLSDIKTIQEPAQLSRWTFIFCSPNPNRYRDTMKTPRKYKFTLPTWSEHELEMCVPANGLDGWYDRFVLLGGVARLVLWDGIGLNPASQLDLALQSKGGAIVDHFFRHGFGNVDEEQSYILMHINPPWNLVLNDWNYELPPVYSFASDEIFQKIASMNKTAILSGPISLFNAGVASNVYGGGSAGNLFEKILLWLNPMAGTTITATGLERQIDVVLELPKKVILPRFWQANKTPSKVGELEINLQYQPKISNLTSGDAFGVVESAGHDLDLYVLQITVGEAHPVKISGLSEIVKSFPPAIQARITRKLLIFVTPKDSPLSGRQPLHTLECKVAVKIPAEVRDFTQYVYRHEIMNERV